MHGLWHSHRLSTPQHTSDETPGKSKLASQLQTYEIERILQLNVLEAVATDLEVALPHNALAGLSVATFVTSRGQLKQVCPLCRLGALSSVRCTLRLKNIVSK